MSNVMKAFDKNAEHLEHTLHKLSEEKSILGTETDKARKVMQEAQKQYAKTGDAADALKASLAGQEYEDYRREMESINETMQATEKQIQIVGEATQNSSSKMKNGISDIVTSFAASGIGDMVGNLATSLSTSIVGSEFGDEGETVFSSALSSAITGATIGSSIPGIGAAVGAGIGTIVGIADGQIKIFGKKDDAYKSYVQEAYEGQISAQGTSLANGSTLAAAESAAAARKKPPGGRRVSLV